MPRLLVIHHSPTRGVASLTEAALAGTHDESIEGVEVAERRALDFATGDADHEDLLHADGYLVGTTKARPFGLYVHGRYDTTGAVRSVLSIVGALGWRQGFDVLEVMGDVTDEHRERAYELGGTIAALVAR